MGHKLLLTLLSQVRATQAHPRRSTRQAQGGFSMAMTLVVILSLILGTLVIASRNSSGFLATVLQGRNREARDVAEAGIAQVINELNRERNRRLLVFGPQASWNDTDDRYKSVCTLLTDVDPATPNAPIPDPAAGAVAAAPTAAALGFNTTSWVPLGAGGNGEFRLVSIAYLNHQDRAGAYPSDDAILSGTNKTLIRVTVESRLGNTGTAQSRVTREFEVVPKCCKRSFGDNTFGANFFGRDNRTCYDDDQGGTGVVTSINGGTVKTSKNTFSIVDDQTPPQPVTEVLCRSDAPTPNTSCVNGDWTLGKSISVVPTEFTVDIPQWPTPTAVITPAVLSITNTQSYLRVNASKTDVEFCSASAGGACTNLSNPGLATAAADDAARRCFSADPLGTGTQFYCKFTQIDSTNNNFIVDTSNGKINLFFDNPQGTPTTSHDYTLVGGNGTFNHVSCSAGQADAGRCSSNATITEIERWNLVAEEPGTFEFRGTSAALAMNLYAPLSDVIWRGGGNSNPNYIGRIWTNGLTLSGSISMQVPLSSPEFCDPITNVNSICNVTGGQPFIDFVARSVSYSSSF